MKNSVYQIMRNIFFHNSAGIFLAFLRFLIPFYVCLNFSIWYFANRFLQIHWKFSNTTNQHLCQFFTYRKITLHLSWRIFHYFLFCSFVSIYYLLEDCCLTSKKCADQFIQWLRFSTYNCPIAQCEKIYRFN